ncbi:MAG: hypothetical protein ACRDZ4_07565 [Egibacteraceae bacterium]
MTTARHQPTLSAPTVRLAGRWVAGVALLGAVVLLAACGGGDEQAAMSGPPRATASSSPLPTQTSLPTDKALPRPVMLAREDLAARLGIRVEDVKVLGVNKADWPDTCLGLPSPEKCAPGPTPGYRVMFTAFGREYRYHSDRVGSFRFAGPGDTPRRP